MQRVPFFSLTRPIQDRFIESTRGQEVPRPILRRRAGLGRQVQVCAIVGGLLLCALGGFGALGFGSLDSKMAIEPPWAMGVYFALACGGSLALFKGAATWSRQASLPFVRGTYLFPVGVIDARSSVIEVHELNQLKDLSVQGSRFSLLFDDGARFEFVTSDPTRSEQIRSLIEGATERVSLPPGELSKRDHVLLNPLLDTGFKNPFAPAAPLQPQPQRWTKFWLPVAIASGIVLGLGFYLVRNRLSEEHLYVNARTLNTSQAYRAYLALGGKHAQVRELLLPRAELTDAVAKGGVAPLERYLDSHPKSKIKTEIEAALRTALLRELARVQSDKSLRQLRQFRARYHHTELIAPELMRAEKALYSSALDHFRSLSTQDPAQLSFFSRLVSYARKHGPKVQIRFQQLVSDSVERAETLLKKSIYYMGNATLPGRYFTAEYLKPLEHRAGSEVRDRLSNAFADDILRFEMGPPLPEDAPDPPKMSVPTLVISHRSNMSGVFLTRRPRGAFVGVGMQFEASFLIPGDDAPLEFKYSAWLPPDLKMLEQKPTMTPKELYESMAKQGFDGFAKKYLTWLFRE